jgi:hypothetical protein
VLLILNVHLCLMAGFGGSVDQNTVLEFIDAGHDMILAADSSASDLIRGIATECGVDFDEASKLFLLAILGLSIPMPPFSFTSVHPTSCVPLFPGSRGNGY